MSLDELGFTLVPTATSPLDLGDLQSAVFNKVRAGKRCLLDHPIVRKIAIQLKTELSTRGILRNDAVAVQAIAFDKTAAKNWKVPWHQDLMFPFASRVAADRFDIPCLKDGIHYARPPESVLSQMLAVRLHLDDCDATNGPLRVSPGSHKAGILRSQEIPEAQATYGELTCLAKKAEALLMRPLTLHASSQATEAKHRRILHLVYYSGDPIPETWHRAI
jgi:ectoine hydroxylase-related dioxygenase (phytanoyl-CoA dioxygenase family)